MKKVLWDAIHGINQQPQNSPITTSSLQPVNPTSTLRARIDAALASSRVSMPLPSLQSVAPMVVQSRFKIVSGAFGIGTSTRTRVTAWVTLRNPFEVDVVVLRIIGNAVSNNGRVVGTIDARFPVPGMEGSSDGSGNRNGSVEEFDAKEPFVIPYTTLNPRISVLSPPIEIESAVDCRSFGALLRAMRRRLEIDMFAKMEVMIGSYGPVILEYSQANVPCVMGAP
ncbi:hypothetical protein HDU76_008919 [Blyttiomyces sp. JEL0837]|nr:hypothetical protein HDU76_008919 [Blyttiomyces sp. JEL0837]